MEKIENRLEKRENRLEETINKLFKNLGENYIFIYTPPKVGSTTLVTSLRVSLGKSYNIIHIHDEVMLEVLTGIQNVTINEIISYLGQMGKNVYVIDVYRTPVERKMSEFFEKLSPYHFNNSEENIQHYSLSRIIARFNKVFPHIENTEHTFDKYAIDVPTAFDFSKKYAFQERNNIKYVNLRLCDADSWTSILSTILKQDIIIIKDYETSTKKIGELYKRFKEEYRLPINYFEELKNNPYLSFYYSDTERNQYIDSWSAKLDNTITTPYTKEEYAFYVNLYLENQYINDVQTEHYIDNGCSCKYCSLKRREIFLKAKNGEKYFDKIIHSEVIEEVKEYKLKLLKELEKKRTQNNKFEKNQFAIKCQNLLMLLPRPKNG